MSLFLGKLHSGEAIANFKVDFLDQKLFFKNFEHTVFS
jgi:hypothetical protein